MIRSPSIRRTLLLRCGLGVGVLLCLLSTGVYLIVRHGLYRELDRSITQSAAMLSNLVEFEDDAITFEWKEGIGTNQTLRDEALFQYWDDTTGETTRSTYLRGKDLPKFRGEESTPIVKNIQLPGSRREFRAIGMRVYPFITAEESERMKSLGRIVDPKSMPHTLVVARDTKSIYRVLNRTRWALGGGTLFTLALGFLLIHRVVRVTLRPIDELARQMSNRTGQHLDSALEVPAKLPDELVSLAENFDSLLARVAEIRQREKDFIRHAAHELRTPIAGLRATVELALSQPRKAADYARHLAVCEKTTIELGCLVTRLSALSRIGQTPSPALLEPVPVGNLLADCIESFLPIFKERNMLVIRDFPAGPMTALGEVTLIRIILNNLLDNAASYAEPGSEIRVGGGVVHGGMEIRIANRADDLPENLERLFEPLFRRNTSRSDADAHLGIGLTLSAEAAISMGATLRARRTNDGWIEFVLMMPR